MPFFQKRKEYIMGNVHMEATQINYRGGSKKMSVEEAIKAAGTEITPEEKAWIDTIPELASQEIIAPEFDAEEGVYAVGDLVIYQGGLYKFTTAHETAGAWNPEEVAAVKVSEELSSLESGLIDVADDVKLNTNDLTTTSRTNNVLPMTVDRIKAANQSATWVGNSCTIGGVTFTVQTDSEGNVVGVRALGTVTAAIFYFYIAKNISVSDSRLFSNGTTYTWNVNKISCEAYNGTASYTPTRLDGIEIPFGTYDIRIAMDTGVSIDTVFYPMLRATTETDATFAPYIPSIDARLAALEEAVAMLTNG
jgi:hypothetical protein